MKRNLAMLVLLGVLSAGCSRTQPCPNPGNVPELANEDVDAVLFLIGDAGQADPAGEPVLEALRRRVTVAVEIFGSDRVLAVFLGDNIYPSGLPAVDQPGFGDASQRLDVQVDVFASLEELVRPVGLFVPGNHDWDFENRDGLERVRHQADRIAKRSGGRAEMLPRNGCPGPVTVDVAQRLRVIALDTHWWLRQAPKPLGPQGGCDAGSEAAVVSALEDQLEQAGERHAVVVAHHPFLSGGHHGGKTASWRRLRVDTQDIPSPRYQAMRQAITGGFKSHPPLIYAAGHEHSLQFLDTGALPFQVISGSGSKSKLTAVGALEETVFCRQSSGFMRLQVARDGRARLGAFVVNNSGTASEVYSTFLI